MRDTRIRCKSTVPSTYNLRTHPRTTGKWNDGSHERQFTLTETTFIKSELSEEALPTCRATGQRVYPLWSRERLQNEAATLKFIASTTTIPVPKFLDLYEENGLLHLKTERVLGMSLDDIASNSVTTHVVNYLESSVLPQLRALRHHTIGSIDATLPVIPPSRITYRDKRLAWPRKTSHNTEFVFCHNDLGQHNILVNPTTLEVTAIIDWEFAGYYTTEFEYPLWLRPVQEQGDDHLEADHLIRFLEDTR
jgi:serine/threonine protein kinase